jgi:hypothetical protein
MSSTKTRAPGDFNTECSLVVHAGHVASRWRGHHKHISGKMAIWNKVDSPVPSAKSSFKDLNVAGYLFGYVLVLHSFVRCLLGRDIWLMRL